MKNRQPLSILFLHISDVFGGAERTTYNLLKNINTEIFKITLITSVNLSRMFSALPVASIICAEDIGLSTNFSYSSPLSNDVKLLSDVLGVNKYDLAFGMMHNASALLACVKKVYSIKTKIISSPRGPLNIFLDGIKVKEEKLFYKIIITLLCGTSDGLIVASNGMRDECVLHFGAKKEKVIVIPNSVDIHDIQDRIKERLKIEIPHEFPIISTACRLSSEKNIPFLIKAFSEIRKERKAKLLIIGDGPEKESLYVLAGALGIRDEVYFVGYQDNPFQYIAASDIFVHTSDFEGFSNSIIEAMACKVPVVSTDCPYGPGEIITNKINGFLVAINDSGGLINAINALLDDRQLKEAISMQGFITASNYSIERMTKAYETYFYGVAHSQEE
jgi:glycosyltransferase involved in cell wall biosynthesis